MGKTIGVVLALKDKCSPQLKKIADSMGITEKEAKKLKNQAKNLSKELGGGIKKASLVCTAALGAVAVATQQLVNNTIQTGDRVDKMSQKIGLSRQKFQEWDYIMSQSGTNIEKMQVGMKTMSQQMVASTKRGSEAEKMFKRLGVSVKDSKGHFKSQEQAFEEIIRAFQRMPDGIEKANMAQKLFGKTGSDLRPLLNGVRGNVDELKKKFHELGMGMSDEQVDASVKLTDTIDTIKRSMGGLSVSIGAEFLPIIQEFSDKFIENMPQIKQAVTPIIQGIVGSLKFLSEHMELIIRVGTTLLSTFMAYQTINGVIKTISTLQKVIKLVTEAHGIWNAVMLANPIGAIAVGAGVLIGALVLLVRNWDKVTEAVKRAIDTVKSFIGLKPGKKTVEIETKQTKNDDKPKKHALGTAFSTGGPAIVGEKGPELLNLKKGDTVTPSAKTQKILQGQNIKIDVNIMGNVIGNSEFVQQIKNVLALELKTALAVV